MEAIIKNELTEILGYEPSRGQILEILKTVKETGRSIIQVAQDRSFPDAYIMRDGKLNNRCGRRYDSIEDYRKEHPHRKLLLITPRSKSNEENGNNHK